MSKIKIPFRVRLEKALMEANKLGLNEVNLEFNPKKLENLMKGVERL
jgi:hypothetical protein